MEALGKYILSVTAASILFGILQSLLQKKSSGAALLRLIGGLFLAFTAISPVADFKLDTILDIPLDLSVQGETFVTQGQEISNDHLQSIIKEQCEAYILDKALSYQAELEVDVWLTQDNIPIPSAVRLQGAVSPYAKSALQNWLQDDMGISKENQLWIG